MVDGTEEIQATRAALEWALGTSAMIIAAVEDDVLIDVVMRLTGGSANPAVVREQIARQRQRGSGSDPWRRMKLILEADVPDGVAHAWARRHFEVLMMQADAIGPARQRVDAKTLRKFQEAYNLAYDLAKVVAPREGKG